MTFIELGKRWGNGMEILCTEYRFVLCYHVAIVRRTETRLFRIKPKISAALHFPLAPSIFSLHCPPALRQLLKVPKTSILSTFLESDKLCESFIICRPYEKGIKGIGLTRSLFKLGRPSLMKNIMASAELPSPSPAAEDGTNSISTMERSCADVDSICLPVTSSRAGF